MRRTITQDQSLIISGDTGSGKSETRRLAIKTLLELYRYLGHRAGTGTRANGVRDDDANRFEQLKSQDGSQLVAAILHLGNIEFIIDRGRDVDAAVVRNVDVLGIVAEFLGVQPSALETTLAYKTKLVKRELCTVFLTLMTLYTLLFAWLNEHVNQRLCRDDFDAFIGLFDLPGPQNMTSRPNSLDKFCIKFANERLQNFIQKCIFESHVDEYQTEGISRFIPSVPYFDNADFLERTLDFLNPDSISLLRGSLAGVGPANPFVKGLFSAKAIATQVHPKNEDTIVSAQQPVKPMRTPSTHRKGTVKIVLLKNKNGKRVMRQIRSLRLTEVSERNVNVFEVGSTLDEFCTRYGEQMAKMGMMDGSTKEKVEQTGNILGLQETDIVLGQYKVFLSQAAFHSLEDRLRSLDVAEQKQNRLRDAEAEAGLDVRSIGDPYAPYASPGLPPDDYTDPYNQVSSQAHVPLMANASPFQRGNLYEDDYEDQTNSNYGSESYAPSRNMFQNADKEGLIAKEALPVAGEIMENETIEVIKEMSALFVIAVLGVVICPTEHIFSTSELASHSFSNSVNNVYTAIHGEVFDLTQVASTHQRVVSVIPTKSILQYGGQDATNLLPVQVSALCNGVSGSVSPWVQLSAANTTDLNTQYHDFRAVSNNSHPDWYFESMTIMHWNNRVGYMGYTPQEISSMANTNGRALGIYDGLIYDLTEYVNFGPSVQGPHGEVAPSADSQFMDSTLVNLFKYSSGQVLTKAINNSTLTPGRSPHRRHASATYSSSEW
ncbi:P-loop containing nucleoside triphosphate hydrolase protein [Boletus edulis BED1]|uniref:P-loop containing nucleoside triphosphate hydrolase protein n=1 Tax=Boletus edulis BED1 TaxID=1328754 RepID=A0AAD4BGZ2_BOLED|nr:P-loop containing nucleoside triphosphate hydrolase protein [Boletus edulis BED1]